MSRMKELAKGFDEDAVKVLNEFAIKNTTEFSEFSEIWRNYHFSLIFMGRPDHVETSEFTNEIFRIALQFFSSSSFYQKVGVVYLLYALFRRQISVPPVKIRLEMSHWKVVKNLRMEAVLKKHYHLHYVIDYLIDNAFMYVTHQMLKGPMIGCMQKLTKDQEKIYSLKTEYRNDIIEYSTSNSLKMLQNLHMEYLDAKKDICQDAKVSMEPSNEAYKKFNLELQRIVNPSSKNEIQETLGSRRAKLKLQSFVRKSGNRFGRSLLLDGTDEETVDEQDLNTGQKKRGLRTKRRVPKELRRVGRPSKHKKPENEAEAETDSEMEMNDAVMNLVSQQQELYLPPEDRIEGKEFKKIRRKRDYYYKVSPKREQDDSSDEDNPS